MQNPRTYPLLVRVNPDYLRLGLHSSFVPFSDELVFHIGKVTAQWSQFEVQFDQLLRYLIDITAPEPKWETYSFTRRRKLMVDKAEIALQGKGEIIAKIRDLCGNAYRLHKRRNLVIHGYYEITTNSGTSEASFTLKSHKKHGESLPLDVPTMEELWHEIAHLNGDLMRLPGFRVRNGVELTWPDSLLLERLKNEDLPSLTMTLAP